MSVPERQWSESQRAFVDSLRQGGATSADMAQKVDRTMALPAAELTQLLDSGIVRDAGRGRYYVYESASAPLSREENLALHMARAAAPVPPPRGKRLILAIVFWLFIILLPIVMIRLFDNR